MAEQAPTSGAGPIELTIGFRFDDSLSKIIKEAKDYFTEQMEQHVKAGAKDISFPKETMDIINNQLLELANLKQKLDQTSDDVNKRIQDTKLAINTLQDKLQTVDDIKDAFEERSKVYSTGKRRRRTSRTRKEELENIVDESPSQLEQSTMDRVLNEEEVEIGKLLRSRIPDEGREVNLTPEMGKERREKYKNTSLGVIRAEYEETLQQQVSVDDIKKVSALVRYARQNPKTKIASFLGGVERTAAEASFWRKTGKAGTKGQMSRQGASEIGDLIPFVNELQSSGEWEGTEFTGQAAVALGSREIKEFLEKRLLGKYGLSEFQKKQLTPDEIKDYTEAAAGIRKGLMEAGSSFKELYFGTKTGNDITGNIVADQPDTQENVKAMSSFAFSLQKYLQYVRRAKGPQFANLVVEVLDIALDRNTGNEAAKENQRRLRAIIQRDPEIARELGVDIDVNMFSRELTEYSVMQEYPRNVKALMINPARKDLLKEGASSRRELFRSVATLPGVPRGLPNELKGISFEELKKVIYRAFEVVSSSGQDRGVDETRYENPVGESGTHETSAIYQLNVEEQEDALQILSMHPILAQVLLQENPELKSSILSATRRGGKGHKIQQTGFNQYLYQGQLIQKGRLTTDFPDPSISRATSALIESKEISLSKEGITREVISELIKQDIHAEFRDWFDEVGHEMIYDVLLQRDIKNNIGTVASEIMKEVLDATATRKR